MKDVFLPFESVIEELRLSSTGLQHPDGALKRGKLPVRDFQMFFREISRRNQLKTPLHNHYPNDNTKYKVPSILPRIAANCFLLELEHIKLLCQSDKCIVMHPNQSKSEVNLTPAQAAEKLAVENFVDELSSNLKSNAITLFSTINKLESGRSSVFELFLVQLDH